MIEHFHEHRPGMETLELAFIDSGFIGLSIGTPETVTAYVDYGQHRRRERIDGVDGAKWDKLLLDAGVNAIFGEDGYHTFEINVDFGRKRSEITQYVHAPGQQQQVNECLDEYSAIGCGMCGVHLDDAWWIHVGWYDNDADSEIEGRYMNDEISDDEYSRLSREAHNACDAEGRRILGYPAIDYSDDWFGSDE